MGWNKRLRLALTALCAVSLLLTPGAYAAEYAPDEVVGSIEGQFEPLDENSPWWKSIPFGNFSADAVREGSGADIALVENRDILLSLADRDILFCEVERAYQPGVELARASLEENQLRAVLEIGTAELTTDLQTESIVQDREALGGVLQVSGMRYSYDPSAPAFSRIVSVTTDKTEGPWLVAAPESVLKAAGIEDSEALTQSLAGLTADYIRSGVIRDFSEERIRALGTAEGSIVRLFPRWVVAAVPLLIAATVVAAKVSMGKSRPFARITEEKNKRFR